LKYEISNFTNVFSLGDFFVRVMEHYFQYFNEFHISLVCGVVRFESGLLFSWAVREVALHNISKTIFRM